MKIELSLEGLEGNKIDGMTFEEMSKHVIKEGKRLRKRMKKEQGDTILRKKWCDKLSPDERDVIKVNQWIKNNSL